MAKPGRPPRKETEATGDQTQSRAFDLPEAGNPGPIEKVAETDFVKAAELENFMQEMVTVYVAPSTTAGELEVITPMVNGVNQPIIRGREIQVKRKYIEALARGRTIVYDQQVQDPSRPENIQMVERAAVTYPFSVSHDPNPKGRAWLEAILAQPA